MSNQKTWAVGLGSALLGALGFYAVQAAAEGAPTTQPLFYSGSVVDKAGAPLEGSHAVSVALFTGPTGGQALCSTPGIATEFEAGRFRVELASGEKGCRQAVASNPDTFVELTVDGAAFPRAKVGAVPYALEADHAQRASALTGAQADAIVQNGTQLTELKQAVAAIPPPSIKMRFLRDGAGCIYNSDTNATTCECELGELILQAGAYGGPNGVLVASRHQYGSDVTDVSAADRARVWTLSCTSLTGASRPCEAVQALCVKL